MSFELLTDVGDMWILCIVSDESIQIYFVLNEGWLDFVYLLQVFKGKEHMRLVVELNGTQVDAVGELMVHFDPFHRQELDNYLGLVD